MRKSSTIAISLLWLTALLLALAALLFTWQSRGRFRDAADSLRHENEEMTINMETQANLIAARETDLINRDLENQDLTERLTDSQTALDDANSQLADAQAELTPLQTRSASAEATVVAQMTAPPNVEIISPPADAIYPLGEPIQLIVSASAASGLLSLNVSANGESLLSLDPEPERLATGMIDWQPEDAGNYEISAFAINARGIASDPVTRTIQIEADSAQPSAEIDDLLAEERAEIEANMATVRGLTPIEPVEPTLLTPAELEQRVEQDILEDLTPEEARDDAIVLSAFDFIPADYDLYAFYTGFLTEQVAGFYDPESDEFVVVSEDQELSPGEKLTHAHEFVHALQDQYFDLGQLDDGSLDGDAALAYRSLAEGDATFAQFQYIEQGYLTLEEIGAYFEELSEAETPIFDDAPAPLVNSFIFPYDAGTAFVQALYNDGGFEAVNNAWSNPPQSTEQILHPERYLAGDFPELVALPALTDTLGVGWRLLDQDSLGEFFLREYLSQQIEEAVKVNSATTGWDGDQYGIYWNDEAEQLAMAYQIVWDTEADSQEFAGAYESYAGKALNTTSTPQAAAQCWLAAETICLYQAGQSTLIIRAPDLDTAQQIAATIWGEG